jgi:putative Mg2+ transporter-C (MgtC) family protein
MTHLRPLVRLVNRRRMSVGDAETLYSVTLRSHGNEEAHIRALLLQAAASTGLALRRLTSENIADSPQVSVSALLVSPMRNDAVLEQIIGRISLEPFITAVDWQAQQAAADG